MTEVTERWLPVVGAEGFYEVSNFGNVRSLDRRVRHRWPGSTRLARGRLLALCPGSHGYPTVALCLGGGIEWTRTVHSLVLEAFAGPCPPSMEALHGPGGRCDNRWPENIRWGTKPENQGPDRVRDGTSNRGERNGQAVLTAAIVRECRRRYAQGETGASLARQFGVSQQTMSAAISGKYWRHVP